MAYLNSFIVAILSVLIPALSWAAPVAHSTELTTEEDVDGGVTLKAESPENLALTFEAYFVKDLKGKVSVDPATGAVSYVPPRDFNGTTNFLYRVCDEKRACSQPAGVRIRVTPVNDKPVAKPVTVMTNQNTPVTVNLKGTDVDGGRLTYKVKEPQTGKVSESDLSGRAVYMPAPDFLGMDKFFYATSDGEAISIPVYVTVEVVPVRLGADLPNPAGFGAKGPAAKSRADAAYADLAALGLRAAHGLGNADLTWAQVEPRQDEWHFEAADLAVKRQGFETVAIVFSRRFASPTPPWVTSSARFQKALNDDAKDYLYAVVERYKNDVRYWQIGDEMENWAVTDPVAEFKPRIKPPPGAPAEGYSAAEQAVFLRDAARFIREHDPDAVIVMPSLAGLSEMSLTWLSRVVAASSNTWFDVVSYRYYGRWQDYDRLRDGLADFLIHNNMIEKKVWLAGTGTSSDPGNIKRTNYPNDSQVQAQDVFRRLLPAFAHGDAMVFWTSYQDPSPSDADELPWSGFGLKNAKGAAKPAYQAMKLLTGEFLPFSRVAVVSDGTAPARVYVADTADGSKKAVTWGRESFQVPDGMTQMTSVLPDAKGRYVWKDVKPGQVVSIPDNDMPYVLK
jgi:hypothetical protein